MLRELTLPVPVVVAVEVLAVQVEEVLIQNWGVGDNFHSVEVQVVQEQAPIIPLLIMQLLAVRGKATPVATAGLEVLEELGEMLEQVEEVLRQTHLTNANRLELPVVVVLQVKQFL
jgi:hypothetical protein